MMRNRVICAISELVPVVGRLQVGHQPARAEAGTSLHREGMRRSGGKAPVRGQRWPHVGCTGQRRFFATLQTELLDRHEWATRNTLRSAIFK